jgi:probable HAF family extracellular repeat protein
MTRRSVAVLIAFLSFALPSFCQQIQPLDLAVRVGYHRAIEEVYWQQRVWPRENPTFKPPLGAVISPMQLQAKVEDGLRFSNALEKYWHQAVTGSQLQAEIARMARNSKQPEVLRQLFSALDNNPRIIAEVLARPLLAERLARSFYEQDARFAAKDQPFETWWSKVRGNFSPAVAESSFTYTLPPITANADPAAPESWSPTFALPEADIIPTAVWTGAEMIIWGGTEVGGGRFSSGSRYNPATDTWTATSTANAPEARDWTAAVWTGSKMLIWGGQTYNGMYKYHNDGDLYDPASNAWIATSLTGAPDPRAFFGYVWTGSELIAWGGCTFNSGGACSGEVFTGGRYNPTTNSWTDTLTAGAPSARSVFPAVWTGNQMIVWGGFDDVNSTYTFTGGVSTRTVGTQTTVDRRGATAGRTQRRLTMLIPTAVRTVLTLVLSLILTSFAGAGSATSVSHWTNAGAAPPSTYVVDFVSTAASGFDMNDAGDVVGRSYPDPGCGSQCLPPEESVVWKGNLRIVLPEVPGLSPIFATGINAQGWVAGFVGVPGTTTHAVVWKPVGNTYVAIDLGNLPGKTISTAVGIDDLGRVVGWSTTANFPPSGAPFLWTEAGGMVDLTTLGFPLDIPIAISQGGTVGTVNFWYRLDDPSNVFSLPPAPRGFVIGADGFEINDAGDQARFLITTGGENLLYLFRFHHEGVGTWQQISTIPTGHLSTAGVGSINDAGDITATVGGGGVVAYGPDGLAQSLVPLVSPAYGGSVITMVGPMNASGQILAQMIIGQSGRRLVRLVPGQTCTTNCIKVTSIQMVGKGPGFCDQGNAQAKARLTVTNEAGTPLSGARITGHFFDDYWLDQIVVGKTNAAGQVTFKHVGPACVGAIAILVTDAATRPGRTFDRTTGILTNYVIPLP